MHDIRTNVIIDLIIYVTKHSSSVSNLINNIHFEFKKKLFVLPNFILTGDKHI